MSPSIRRSLLAAVAAAGALLSGLAAPQVAAAATDQSQFVTRHGADLQVGSQPFRFAGTNNYYLHYKSGTMRDAVLDKAAAQGFSVVRTWGWYDTQNKDGSGPAGAGDGVSFQYWDAATQRPAYNDGPNGLQRLDAVVARAAKDHLRLVIPFTDNWGAFGGMDQYVKWAGDTHHDDFYTDARIRGWYRDYIAHVLNRTNSITGVKYKDDPTIMTWELANEPRCVGPGAYPRSADCTTDTLTNWADGLSTFIKGVDSKHLVSVGDEGFFCRDRKSEDFTQNCGEGVDTVRFAQLPNIDVMSYHLYPDSWGKTASWGTHWIRAHTAAADSIGKPVMLGEFGLRDKAIRNSVYQQWTDTILSTHADGALYWILSDVQDDGTLYPDYDGFTVYCPSPVCTTVSQFADRIAGRATGRQAPVADDDSANVDFGQAASLKVTANDIAHAPAVLKRVTVDLDPATAGVQTRRVTAAGTWTASWGTVTFAPVTGWSGRATTTYVVSDSLGATSQPAMITVNGKPEAGAALTLFDFESGTQGWAPSNWQTDPGSVATSTAYHFDGTQSLHVDSRNAWFGSSFAAPLVLTGRSSITFAMSPTPASVPVSFQSGPDYTWCQVQANRSTSDPALVEVDLLSSTCDLTDVRAMNVFVSTGSVDLDAVQAH